MSRSEALAILKAHLAELRAMGVASLALFGSVARNEARSDSDVDLLVEFERPVGLFHFFQVQHTLESILGARRVDLVERGQEHPALRDRILREAVNVA